MFDKDLDLFLVSIPTAEEALARVEQLLNNFLAIERQRVQRQREREHERLLKMNQLEEWGTKFDIDIKVVWAYEKLYKTIHFL